MTTEAETSSNFDAVKWIATIALLGGAVFANHYVGQMESVAFIIRILIVIALIALGLAVAATTTKGKTAVNFARESRMEIRKVVWPTRQEATQTTLIIVAFVIVVALFLWGVDALLGWGVNSLMGI